MFFSLSIIEKEIIWEDKSVFSSEKKNWFSLFESCELWEEESCLKDISLLSNNFEFLDFEFKDLWRIEVFSIKIENVFIIFKFDSFFYFLLYLIF